MTRVRGLFRPPHKKGFTISSRQGWLTECGGFAFSPSRKIEHEADAAAKNAGGDGDEEVNLGQWFWRGRPLTRTLRSFGAQPDNPRPKPPATFPLYVGLAVTILAGFAGLLSGF